MERLDKRLAATGRWSRREARELIRAGRVCIDGVPARAPEDKVDDGARLTVDGEALGGPGSVYIMLHKPAGVVSATEDQREKTVLDLLPEEYARAGLFPVGRLDKDTEGLLQLTNDGALAHAMLSPRRHVDKVYLARTAAPLTPADSLAFRQGVTLADGYTCQEADLEILPGGNEALVTIREGKYHQIKRMMAARGNRVEYLKRLRMGSLTLDPELARGCWRLLTDQERTALISSQ